MKGFSVVVALGLTAVVAGGARSADQRFGLPQCAPGSVVAALQTDGETGTLLIWADLFNTGAACNPEPVRLAVVDARTHRRLPVVGNPVAVRIRTPFIVGQRRRLTAAWGNFCQQRADPLIIVRVGRTSATLRVHGPSCQAPGVHSTLTVTRVA